MLNFWIIIDDLDELEAKKLYLKHKNSNISCTVLKDHVYLHGTVTKSKLDSILDDVIELCREYSVSIREIT